MRKRSETVQKYSHKAVASRVGSTQEHMHLRLAKGLSCWQSAFRCCGDGRDEHLHSFGRFWETGKLCRGLVEDFGLIGEVALAACYVLV